MPVVDYQCEVCGYRWDEFHHRDPPDWHTCPGHLPISGRVCGCHAPRIASYPGERLSSRAQGFDPIVVWVADDDPNKISIPGSASDPVDPGYHKVEIRTLREADLWTDRINRIETEKVKELRAAEREYWDEVTRRRREDIQAKIGSNPKAKALFQAVKEYVDRKREKRYSGSLDARAHFQVIAYDSGKREGWSGPETGWKTRKS